MEESEGVVAAAILEDSKSQAKRLPYKDSSGTTPSHSFRAKKCCRAGAPPATIFSTGHPPRVPVWLRWERPVIYFITICVANREPVLANERAFAAFKAAVAKLQHWTVLAAVLMPDHLHVIASPTDARGAKFGNFSAALKRWIRRELNAAWSWQPGCFDRLLRSDESLHEKRLYIEDNPVRAGLVERTADGHIELA